MVEKGTLYVCPTPIGNLADITLRVLETLKQSDIIAAEDTRHSRKLLDHYSISTPMISYHEHNEKKRASELVERLKKGEIVSLISDAGMPGISDPGWEIIQLCQAENIKIDVLPGPNAAITALVLSGLPTDSFAFHGFLPSTKSKRQKKIAELGTLPFTQIFYEAPHRLTATLSDFIEILGDRECAVVRELTKKHQSVRRGMLSELLNEYTATPPKGECCIILAPWKKEVEKGGPEEWVEAAKSLMEQGKSRQEALKEIAKRYGVPKRDIYQAMLKEGGQ